MGKPPAAEVQASNYQVKNVEPVMAGTGVRGRLPSSLRFAGFAMIVAPTFGNSVRASSVEGDSSGLA